MKEYAIRYDLLSTKDGKEEWTTGVWRSPAFVNNYKDVGEAVAAAFKLKAENSSGRFKRNFVVVQREVGDWETYTLVEPPVRKVRTQLSLGDSP